MTTPPPLPVAASPRTDEGIAERSRSALGWLHTGSGSSKSNDGKPAQA